MIPPAKLLYFTGLVCSLGIEYINKKLDSGQAATDSTAITLAS